LVSFRDYKSWQHISFGPTEYWDEIYFLDARDFLKNRVKIYKITLSSMNEKFQSLKVSKDELYKDHCKQKRRPRISFKSINEQLGSDECFKIVFDDHVDKILD
jgi:hypothetical protein